MKYKIILAIESSCDETAVAILKNGKDLLSNKVVSQIDVHSKFGGVIPEVASRIHIESISLVIKEALADAKISISDIDAFAVTYGPGLIGCLHIGLIAAKSLAFYYNKPLLGVHHIAGHIFANAYVSELKYPLLSLVVSGGHSEILLMENDHTFKVVASTLDDAIGEAYDKVARIMNLGYPGGPVIDKLAKQGKPHYQLPITKLKNDDELSFSGLKSGVLQLIEREKKNGNEIDVKDLAFAFQERALSQIIDRVQIMLNKYNPKMLVVAGGVAANSRLRELCSELIESYPNIELVLPPMWCCTDNAAMIAMAANCLSDYKEPANLNLSACSNLSISNN